MTDPSLLSIDRLTLEFPIYKGAVKALNGVTLCVEPGEIVGVVGESGSGKSVTALAILRLLGPAARVEGSIRLDGAELLRLDEEKMRRCRGQRVAIVFQEPMTALNPVMTVGEQMAEALRAHQSELSRRQERERVIEAMEAVALPSPAARYGDYPHQFSGGQRQRILIAMAILNRPDLLIADEPATALDVTVQAQILELLADLRQRYGLSMLFISHDLAVVGSVADQVLVMRHGVMLERGSRADVFQRPQHAYTRSLLGAVPTLKTERSLPLATLPSAPEEERHTALAEAAPGHWVRM